MGLFFDPNDAPQPGSPAALLALMQAAKARRGPLAAPRPAAPLAAPPGPGGAPSPAFLQAFAGMGEPDADERGGPPDRDGDDLTAVRDAGPMIPPEVLNASSIDGGPAASNAARGALDQVAAGGAPALKRSRGGVFDRIGDFVGSDRGKGALFRAGASMLSTGNIGGGMMAGANYVDEQKALDRAQAEKDRMFSLDTKKLGIDQQNADETALYHSGALANSANQNMIDMMRAEATARHNAAAEGIDWAKITQADRHKRIDAELKAAEIKTAQRGQDITAETARRGQDIGADTSRYATDSSRIVGLERNAWEQGPETTTKAYDDDGNVVEQSTARRPVYGELRYDTKGQAYRKDPLTGAPIPVTPSTIGTRPRLGR